MTEAEIQTEMVKINKRLRQFYTAGERYVWLRSPHPQLEGRKAVDAVRSGDAAQVHEILDRLESGGYL